MFLAVITIFFLFSKKAFIEPPPPSVHLLLSQECGTWTKVLAELVSLDLVGSGWVGLDLVELDQN